MKKFVFLAVAALSFLLASCTEEGFTKVFKCDNKYPYFSTITHKCYETKDALADGEKDYKEQMAKDSKVNDDDDDDADEDKKKKDDVDDDDEDDEEEEDAKKGGDDDENDEDVSKKDDEEEEEEEDA